MENLVIPYRIHRDYIIRHPEYTFVYSCCWWPNIYVGPALVCKELDNCCGVAVRWKLCKSSGYYSDQQADLIKKRIDEDVGKIPTDKPVILFPKIGNGDSRMHVFAPICYAYLHNKLDMIKADFKYTYQ